jgi:hypothetical protein
MKKIAGMLSVFLVAAPFIAIAHEHQSFEINGIVYDFGIGSLNEPLTVDDKSGVELDITRVGPAAHTEGGGHSGGAPALGLEEALKVELVAGDKRKTLDFSPIYGVPGGYKAPFYPTIATTLSYRVFGEIEGTPFDYTFTCNPAGHAPAPEDTSRVQVSDKVFRIHKSGSFGCPVEKASMGFPEESADIVSLKEDAQGGAMIGWVAGAVSLVALAVAFRRRS